MKDKILFIIKTTLKALIIIFVILYVILILLLKFGNDVSEEDFLKNQEGYQELADAFYKDDEIRSVYKYRGDLYLNNYKEKYIYGKERIYYKNDGYYVSDDYNTKYSAEKIDYYLKLLKKSNLYRVYQPIGWKNVWLIKEGWVNKDESRGYIYDPTGEYTIDSSKSTSDIKLNDNWHTVNR
ncbi:MAG: hypothetical protein ABII02_02115 [Candidatus Magasanikbacteria bacterium]